MRVTKRFLGILLSAVLLLSMGYSVKAEDNNTSYTYTVRILAGKQGSIDTTEVVTVKSDTATISCNGDMVIISNLQYNDNIVFDRSKVTKSDENKYYVKGFRESGKDSGELAAVDFLVTEDRDYVVAYGLMKDMHPYVVRYQDADGNTLSESETYYGSIGDKPIVAYKYIDGYQPQAYNLTKTLVGDPEKDVFVFTYTPIPPGTVVTRYTTVVIPGTFTDLGTEVIDDGLIPGGEGPGGPGGENPGGPGEEINLPDEPQPLTPPEELEDLDIQEEDLPTTPFENALSNIVDAITGNAFLVSIPVPVKLCMALLVAALLGVGIWQTVKYHKRKKA